MPPAEQCSRAPARLATRGHLTLYGLSRLSLDLSVYCALSSTISSAQTLDRSDAFCCEFSFRRSTPLTRKQKGIFRFINCRIAAHLLTQRDELNRSAAGLHFAGRVWRQKSPNLGSPTGLPCE